MQLLALAMVQQRRQSSGELPDGDALGSDQQQWERFPSALHKAQHSDGHTQSPRHCVMAPVALP